MQILKAIVFAALAVVSYGAFAPIYRLKESIPDQYLVVFREDIDIEKIGNQVQSAMSLRGLVGSVMNRIKLVNALSVRLSEEALDMVRRLDGVLYIEEDGVAHAMEVASWGLDRIDQRSMPMDGTYSPIGTGTGVSVYVIDTGINPTHVDFEGRGKIGYDAMGGDGVDCNGHGTHCAGTVGGGAYGVAKNVALYGVRTLGCLGSGSYSGIIDGMDWVAANAELPAVASMSLGGGASLILDLAVNRLVDAGVVVSVAAGNSNDDSCNYSPARAARAITVGATDNTDTRASFSCYGRCVDLFAPGQDITSAWRGSDTAVRTISGTSMACPHVSGAAALILEANPSADPDTVTSTLINHATPNVLSDVRAFSPNLLLYTH